MLSKSDDLNMDHVSIVDKNQLMKKADTRATYQICVLFWSMLQDWYYLIPSFNVYNFSHISFTLVNFSSLSDPVACFWSIARTTMVITAAQTTTFFENPDQMGIPHMTVVQVQVEGITVIEDLADFDKDTLQQLADNLRKPAGHIPDPNPVAAAGATIPTPSFVFGAKSQHRISVACGIVRYYNAVGRDITAANMRWTQVIKNFKDQWKALKGHKEDDKLDVPKISKSLTIIKWTEVL